MRTIAAFMDWVLGETGYEYWYQFTQARPQCRDFYHKLRDLAEEKTGTPLHKINNWCKVELTGSEWDELAAELKQIFPLPIMPRMRPPNPA